MKMKTFSAQADYHMHTVFSDGQDTAEEMILGCIALGIPEIGFSDHSYLSFDPSWCMNPGKYDEYRQEIRALAKKYKKKIRVYCGIEQDYYSDAPQVAFDYVIGSVHALEAPDGTYISVDCSAALLKDATDRFFNGDFYALSELYYETVSHVVEKTGADIIGHFDLISKFSEQTAFFDPDNERYVAAWKRAADRLLLTGKPFELNYGAISRGYRTSPYPSAPIYAYLCERGAQFVYGSDSHKKGDNRFLPFTAL